jgi:hypothetical protein
MPHIHVIGPPTYAGAPRAIDLVGESGPEPVTLDTAPSEPTSPGHPTDEAAPVVLTAARVARLPRQRVTPRVTDDGPEAA